MRHAYALLVIGLPLPLCRYGAAPQPESDQRISFVILVAAFIAAGDLQSCRPCFRYRRGDLPRTGSVKRFDG